MAAINSSSLFHFTKEITGIKGIITNGVRFSYSFEPLPNDDFGNAIPMACFCDIPLLRTSKHKSRYGSYMIGIDKSILLRYYHQIINPVTYLHSDNAILAAKEFPQLFDKLQDIQCRYICDKAQELTEAQKEKYINNIEPFFSEFQEVEQFISWRFCLEYMQGLYKPYEGKDTNGDTICFYDEREWRAFWLDGLSEDTDWGYNMRISDYKEKKDEWNTALENSENGHISLARQDLQEAITHIVVPEDSNIPEIIEHILQTETIFGAVNLTREDRLMLISRITSFERIENDY
ncbi:MAG: abortive infection system antitoxin AbiGi family protein [Rikenellaceae bacterium]